MEWLSIWKTWVLWLRLARDISSSWYCAWFVLFISRGNIISAIVLKIIYTLNFVLWFLYSGSELYGVLTFSIIILNCFVLVWSSECRMIRSVNIFTTMNNVYRNYNTYLNNTYKHICFCWQIPKWVSCADRCPSSPPGRRCASACSVSTSPFPTYRCTALASAWCTPAPATASPGPPVRPRSAVPPPYPP